MLSVAPLGLFYSLGREGKAHVGLEKEFRISCCRDAITKKPIVSPKNRTKERIGPLPNGSKNCLKP